MSKIPDQALETSSQSVAVSRSEGSVDPSHQSEHGHDPDENSHLNLEADNVVKMEEIDSNDGNLPSVDYFFCDNCSFSTLDRLAYEDHSIHCDAIPVVSCSYCTMHFVSSKLLERHIASEHMPVMNIAQAEAVDYDDVPLTLKNAVHLDGSGSQSSAEVAGMVLFICNICDMFFTSTDSLREHQSSQTHLVRQDSWLATESNPFPLIESIAQLSRDTLFQCSSCNLCFQHLQMLVIHCKQMHENPCKQMHENPCKQMHENPRKQMHENPEQSSHGTHVEPSNDKMIAEALKCNYCSKILSSVYTKREHVRNMHSLRCKLCKEPFYSEEERFKHWKRHPRCKICNKSFKYKETRRRHWKKYHKEPKINLELHEIKKDLNTKIKCQHCKKTFDRQLLLKKHQLRDHPKMFKIKIHGNTKLKGNERASEEKEIKRNKPQKTRENEKEASSKVNPESTSATKVIDVHANIVSATKVIDVHVNIAKQQVYECAVCQKRFSQNHFLRNHIMASHPKAGKSLLNLRKPSQAGLHMCILCKPNQNFQTKSKLISHLQAFHRKGQTISLGTQKSKIQKVSEIYLKTAVLSLKPLSASDLSEYTVNVSKIAAEMQAACKINPRKVSNDKGVDAIIEAIDRQIMEETIDQNERTDKGKKGKTKEVDRLQQEECTGKKVAEERNDGLKKDKCTNEEVDQENTDGLHQYECTNEEIEEVENSELENENGHTLDGSTIEKGVNEIKSNKNCDDISANDKPTSAEHSDIDDSQTLNDQVDDNANLKNTTVENIDVKASSVKKKRRKKKPVKKSEPRKPHIIPSDMCIYCGVREMTAEQLQIHIEQECLVKKTLKCNICDGTFTIEKTFLDHQIVHKQCDVCLERFVDSPDLKTHTSLHPKCEVCEDRFLTTTAMIAHLKEVHNKSYAKKGANARGFVFLNESNMFECVECKAEYAIKVYAQRHLIRDHPNLIFRDPPAATNELQIKYLKSPVAKSYDTKPLQCPQCNETFIRKHLLKRHIEDVHTYKALPEKSCSYIPSTPHFYERSCVYCKETVDKSVKGQRKHYKEKHPSTPIGTGLWCRCCPYCEHDQFRDYNCLRLHVNNRHKEKWNEHTATTSYDMSRFWCHFCGYYSEKLYLIFQHFDYNHAKEMAHPMTDAEIKEKFDNVMKLRKVKKKKSPKPRTVVETRTCEANDKMDVVEMSLLESGLFSDLDVSKEGDDDGDGSLSVEPVIKLQADNFDSVQGEDFGYPVSSIEDLQNEFDQGQGDINNRAGVSFDNFVDETQNVSGDNSERMTSNCGVQEEIVVIVQDEGSAEFTVDNELSVGESVVIQYEPSGNLEVMTEDGFAHYLITALETQEMEVGSD